MRLRGGQTLFTAKNFILDGVNAVANAIVDEGATANKILVLYRRKWWALFFPRPTVKIEPDSTGELCLWIQQPASRQVGRAAQALTETYVRRRVQELKILPLGKTNLQDFTRTPQYLEIRVPPGTKYDRF